MTTNTNEPKVIKVEYIDEHTRIEYLDTYAGPSYDPDADDWDWSDEDKEIGIGCHIGGSRR